MPSHKAREDLEATTLLLLLFPVIVHSWGLKISIAIKFVDKLQALYCSFINGEALSP